MEHYDLCIIGGGPSGYAAAMRAVDFKKKVPNLYEIWPIFDPILAQNQIFFSTAPHSGAGSKMFCG